MRWASEWWGITLIAESKGDETFLRDLQSRLPKKPKTWTETYDNGEMEVKTDEETGEFCLIFNR